MRTPTNGTCLEVNRGPNWLFVKLRPGKSKAELSELADDLWVVVQKHFVYRLVVEMDEFDALPDVVIRQLAELRSRLEEHDGALRVCGLREKCAAKLENFRLDHTMHCHHSRESAVLGAENAHDCPSIPHFDSDFVTSSTASEVAQAH